MIPTFVIFFREGIEASMIVAILLSYLKRIGQRRHFRDVYWGVAAALVLIVAGGVGAYEFIDQYNGSNVQTYFETATYLVAAGALTYMTFWMQRHARSLAHDLEQRSDLALSGGARAGLGLLAFQAVGREGLETMVFTLAIIFASAKQAGAPLRGNYLLLGAALGLALALGVAFAIYRLGAKLNLRRFFQVLGVVLMIFAAGLLADAVENLQRLGWLPFGRHVLWNSSHFVSEASSIGDALHSLLGYAERPTLLQALVWVVYVAISMTAFIGRGGRRARHHGPPEDATSSQGSRPSAGNV
ncbi:MAG TPA: FTR1 family protein [Acidimicrobiales bacterium]|nr:FTR1 family protein [Acidimicrobiales bacterium]